jgi:hypothetical protein
MIIVCRALIVDYREVKKKPSRAIAARVVPVKPIPEKSSVNLAIDIWLISTVSGIPEKLATRPALAGCAINMVAIVAVPQRNFLIQASTVKLGSKKLCPKLQFRGHFERRL